MSSDPFHYGPARVFVDDVEVGHVVEITMRHADGRAPAGSCPECARLPLSDESIVCAHGVAVRLRL